jgi:hypothetical protein
VEPGQFLFQFDVVAALLKVVRFQALGGQCKGRDLVLAKIGFPIAVRARHHGLPLAFTAGKTDGFHDCSSRKVQKRKHTSAWSSICFGVAITPPNFQEIE